MAYGSDNYKLKRSDSTNVFIYIPGTNELRASPREKTRVVRLNAAIYKSAFTYQYE